MKKFFLILVAMATMFTMASCDKTTNYTPLYDVEVVGDADGNVEVTFPQGTFNLDGKTDLTFHYGNAFIRETVISENEAMQTNDEHLALFLEHLYTEFNATAASGTYSFKVKGFVKEPITGLVIEIDRTFTNRE